MAVVIKFNPKNDENENNDYYTLNQPSVRKRFNSITTGQAYPQISLEQVRQAEVRLPSLLEQTTIAEVLSDMDVEIAALEDRRLARS